MFIFIFQGTCIGNLLKHVRRRHQKEAEVLDKEKEDKLKVKRLESSRPSTSNTVSFYK